MTDQQLSMIFMDNAEYFPEEIWRTRLFYDLIFNNWTIGISKVYERTHEV